jgi:hypothetical protein
MNNDEISKQLDTSINDEDMVMRVIPVVASDIPLNLPDGHTPDNGQIMAWTPHQVRDLQSRVGFYFNADDKYHAPVILLYSESGKEVGEATCERIESFEKLVERLKVNNCIVHQIIQNSITGSFMLRKFDIPENFDYTLHLIIQAVNEILYIASKCFNKDGKILDRLYPDVVNLAKKIVESPNK